MLTQLIHNGVAVPEPPSPVGLVLTIRGKPTPLSPEAEEMALAWARKHGTPYVRDATFVKNFLADFSRALGLAEPLSEPDVDFGPAIQLVTEEREARARMAPEERKALASERKARREALRERHGYALVDGERVPLANYIVEPSGIFMGRGQHPLRGRWKQGARRMGGDCLAARFALGGSLAGQALGQDEVRLAERYGSRQAGEGGAQVRQGARSPRPTGGRAVPDSA